MTNTIGFSKNRVQFAGFKKETGKQKQYVMGEKLWNTLLKRDNDFGGYLVEINGLMGSGKTSLLLGMADKILKKYPNESIFWREPIKNPLQVTKLGDPKKFQILSERRYPLQVYEVTDEKITLCNDYKIRYFEGVKHLVKKSKKGMVNLVYFKDLYKWADLLMLLRFNSGWQTILVDEMEDVCPQRCSNKGNNKTWDKNELLGLNIKEIRKNKVNLVYNTQVGSSDVDSRIRSKCMVFFYLYGSKYDERAPMSRQAFRSLSIGSSWIDFGHSLWGRLKFKPYKPIGKHYMIIPEEEKHLVL